MNEETVEELAKWLHQTVHRQGTRRGYKVAPWDGLSGEKQELYLELAGILLTDPPACLLDAMIQKKDA